MHYARVIIEESRQDYNEQRPHSSIGYLTPNQFADSFLTADSKLVSY
ncbi:integrase core domain-containing protein [Undibacterium sp. SXout7W]